MRVEAMRPSRAAVKGAGCNWTVRAEAMQSVVAARTKPQPAACGGRPASSATAANGAEGLQQVGRQRPDLILLDLMMPVMDGQEMLRRLKDDASLRTIPVVVMSAGRVTKAELQGSPFLPKPFELDDLLDTVTAQLTKKT